MEKVWPGSEKVKWGTLYDPLYLMLVYHVQVSYPEGQQYIGQGR
jgi:hypothetical protein